jgi:hypothetical protein
MSKKDERKWKELRKFAMQEMKLAGLAGKKAIYNGKLATAVLELMETFHRQNHSLLSAETAIYAFKRLARFLPLTPLECDEDEWIKHADDLYQNKRMMSVFKDDKGVFCIEAIKFVEPNGYAFYGIAKAKNGIEISSKQYFNPPLLPKTFVVHVDENRIIIDEDELIPVFKMYIKPDTYKIKYEWNINDELIKNIYYYKHNDNAYRVKIIYNQSNKCNLRYSIFTVTKDELEYFKSKYKDIIAEGWQR